MNISVTFEIPFGKVSLDAIEKAVRQSLKESGRLMIKTLLEALQKRLSFMLQALHPERFVKNGRHERLRAFHGRLQTFKTSFGKGPWIPLGLLVNQSWTEVRKGLKRFTDYERLEVLISDGEPEIEALLRKERDNIGVLGFWFRTLSERIYLGTKTFPPFLCI
jgi:hypothetical protein